MLSFQNLDVYRCAVEFLAMAGEHVEVPRGHSALADQLRRAAVSIPLNIAEASGRATAIDAARHFAIARGSAMECAAIMDAYRLLEVIDEQRYSMAVQLLERIVAMLSKLCR